MWEFAREERTFKIAKDCYRRLLNREGGKGGGGSRSHFMENKMVFSQFTKN